MSLAIEPFGLAYVDLAAALLAARQRTCRSRDPDLPALFESAGRCLPLVQALADVAGASGSIALHDGRAAGFLLAVPWHGGGPRTMHVLYAGMAAVDAEGSNEFDLYHALYAAAAPRWLADGSFDHFVSIPAADTVAIDAWFSLGFGREAALGLRDTGPLHTSTDAFSAAETLRTSDRREIGPATASIDVYRAGTEDLDPLTRMAVALSRDHAGPPIWLPFLPDGDSAQRTAQREMLANEANACWLAYRDGRPLGYQSFTPAGEDIALVVPAKSCHLRQGFTEPDARGSGAGTALLDAGLAWALDEGYRHCVVIWKTANASGARFWQGHGFRPIGYRLQRRVDPRIAWAHPRQ